MSLTIAQARDSILALFRTGWIASAETVDVPVFWPDKKTGTKGVASSNVETPPSDEPWARVTLQNVVSGQSSLADNTNKKIFTRNGVLTVQIFTPYGTGLTKSYILTKVVQDTFEGKATSNGVWFRNVRANEIGQNGEWHQTNVLVEFEYDEVK